MKVTPTSAAEEASKEFPALVANMPASVRHRSIALGVLIFLSAVFFGIMPFARSQPGRLDAFIPVVQTLLCFADVITAIFLFAQYSIQPKRSLLALASGYIFSGVFAFLQTLDFPGAYGPTGLLSHGPSGAAWMFAFWHLAFPLTVIAYALLKDGDEPVYLPDALTPRRSIAVTLACVFGTITILAWAAAAEHLPAMFIDLTRQTVFAQYSTGVMFLVSATAILFLFLRMRTILDVWLIVTLLVSLPDLALSFLYPVVRFSLGWYAARSYALIASCAVLVVLLVETTMLYTRLASATILRRRERADRLLSVEAATGAIAHEIGQPLAGISVNCSVGLDRLQQSPPDLDRARVHLRAAINGSNEAVELIASIRGMFRRNSQQRTLTDLNGVARQALDLLKPDLDEHAISVTTKFSVDVPYIWADRNQLQQVILNLIRNAGDAINARSRRLKSIGVETKRNGSSVSLSVHDTGPGIGPEDIAQIFDPFFTTKSFGMGLGLSICRTIIEDHGGELRLSKSDASGSTFETSLPLSSPPSRN